MADGVGRAGPAAALAVSVLCGSAMAGDGGSQLYASAPATGWTITLTGTVEVGPLYDGGRRYGLGGLPSVSWRPIGTPDTFGAPDDSLDYTLFESGRFSFGPVLNVRFGRHRRDDKRLAGLRSVPWTIEPGVFAQYWLLEDRLRARVEIRRGFHDHTGFTSDLSVDWVEQLGRFTLSGGPRLSLGDAAFMRANFGISPAEAAVSGAVPAFSPGAGAKSVGIETALSYAWNDTWTTTLFGRYDRLVGPAAESPVADVLGSRDQFTLGLSVAWSFDWVTGSASAGKP